jgi:hypothetical protein
MNNKKKKDTFSASAKFVAWAVRPDLNKNVLNILSFSGGPQL